VKFFLGTHLPGWLNDIDVPLFVSHRQLKKYRWLPVPAGEWALDSGAFTELSMFGEWRTTPTEYIAAVDDYMDMGKLAWAAPMDWPCEPWMTEKTGLPVYEHQYRTVISYLELRDHGPFIPVLQGWTLDDYLDCVALYSEAKVDLTAVPVVGLGSVCRRQATGEIETIVRELAGLGIRLHGFGVKTRGFSRYGHLLASADSMAWSFQARRSPPLPGCTSHKNCANCSRYALRWRSRVLDGFTESPEQLAF
jgi:hypothetical protein